MDNQKSIETELIDYVLVISRRRKFIFLGTFLLVVIAGVVSFTLPPLYEATTQIKIGRVWDKELENPYLTSELINSDAFLEKVIKKLNLSITPFQLKRKELIKTRVLEWGASGQKIPVLLTIQTRSHDPQEAVNLGNVIGDFLVEDHQQRYEERLKEYKEYEKDLRFQVTRIEEQVNELEQLIKKQSLNPAVSAPSVILLQAQLEQKSAQLLTFKKELKDTRINNYSSLVTENTRIVSMPVLPREHINPHVVLNMVLTGMLGFFITLILAFFLEYLKKARTREVGVYSHEPN
ncbi:MAG TPA: Wzz/FepE/Etk N-terminal domain-containing protein [Candidatus Nitrosotenuis sp.]|nr:Wzz/FepE/Etk N-terminal domain-containing protein [Candidatus Nitrosotenuis sp.]